MWYFANSMAKPVISWIPGHANLKSQEPQIPCPKCSGIVVFLGTPDPMPQMLGIAGFLGGILRIGKISDFLDPWVACPGIQEISDFANSGELAKYHLGIQQSRASGAWDLGSLGLQQSRASGA